jgi:hypothetical protein
MSASLTIFEKEHAAREKYIYFVCGLAGALFAYIGKDYFPVHPLDLVAKLNIWAMVCLMLCLVSGMARIQVYIEGLSINRDELVAEEELKNLRECWVKHKSGESNFTMAHKTGKKYTTIEELQKDIEALQKAKDATHKRMEKWFRWATGLLIICNCFLAFGFLLIVFAKLAG